MKENWIAVVSVLIAACAAAPKRASRRGHIRHASRSPLVGNGDGTGLEKPPRVIHFEVTDAHGIVTAWTAETAGLVILIRAGWTSEL